MSKNQNANNEAQENAVDSQVETETETETETENANQQGENEEAAAREEAETANQETGEEEAEEAGEAEAGAQEQKQGQSHEDNAAAKAARVRAEQEAQTKFGPIAAFVDELAKTNGFENIAQYMDAVREQQKQAQLDELIQQNIPTELAAEILENRKFREKFAEKERQQEEIEHFFQSFPEVKADMVPDEVWAEFNQGGSLVNSYKDHLLKDQETQIADLQRQLAIEKQNNDNAASTPGSLKGRGSETEKLFTAEEIEEMSTEEIAKNWDKVQKSLNQKRG